VKRWDFTAGKTKEGELWGTKTKKENQAFEKQKKEH